MYDDLDNNIYNYEFEDFVTENEWNNYGMEFNQEIVDNFTEEDWNKLHQELKEKSPIWKRRLSDLLMDTNNPNHLKTLIEMSNTNDRKLFVNIIAILYDFDLTNVENINSLYEKTKQFIESENDYGRSILVDFLKEKGIE